MKAIVTITFSVEDDLEVDMDNEKAVERAVEKLEKKYTEMSVEDLQKFGEEEDRQVEIEE